MEMKQIYSLFTKYRCRYIVPIQRYCSSGTVTTKTEKLEIKIPPRIERGPTDILRALASTVSRDLNAPHYKYHDDPFLIPSSNIGKRTFALAKESGRKAAQWIAKEHADLFKQSLADPEIPSFLPKTIYKEDTIVSENDLIKCIDNIQVEDALIVSQLCEKQNIEISLETKQSLLELLCFYNCEEPIAEDLVEERWFTQGTFNNRIKKTWKDGGTAEWIFASIENDLKDNNNKDLLSKAKCTLIRGMCKYGQATKAWEMYQNMKGTDEKIDTRTYNSLIQVTSYVKDSHESRWQLIEETLRDMNRNKVAPDLGTLNSVLEVFCSMGTWQQTRTLTLRCLAEFKQAGVIPSLATYYFILVIFCRERGPTSNILIEIMNELEGKDIKLRHIKDTYFFVTAMDICRNHLGDTALARRVHSLLHAYNNYDLIGDSYKESIYYRHFFTLICNLEPLDAFMEIYNKYVPHIYIPEPSVMEEIVKTAELHEAWDLLPRLWSDIFIFDQADRVNILNSWLRAAVLSNQFTSIDEDGIVKQTGLAIDLCKSAKQLWDKIESQPETRTNPIKLNGPMLGNVLVIAVRAFDFEFAAKVMNKIKVDVGTSAPPDLVCLKEYIKTCVENNILSQAVLCVQYTIDAGFPEAAILANELQNNKNLTSTQKNKLTSMLSTSGL